MLHILEKNQKLVGGNVILFTDEYHSFSKECNLVKDLLEEVEGEYGASISFWITKDTEVFSRYSINSIPSLVFLLGDKQEIATRVSGANPSLIMSSLKQAFTVAASNVSTSNGGNPSIEDRLTALIGQEKLMLFIKGSPLEPRCGFTRQLMSILAESNINSFGTFDILGDEEVRQALKIRSNWPTYPQIYLNSEFIGGLDIIREMKEDPDMWSSFMARL